MVGGMDETKPKMRKKKGNVLFGGAIEWKAEDWTASDDRVRGGKSVSHLTPLPSHPPSPPPTEPHYPTAVFHGHLDITTLGAAGFASQHTTTTQSWDLSAYSGITLTIPSGDDKIYTFTLKDQIPKTYSTDLEIESRIGIAKKVREEATVSWEGRFRCTDRQNWDNHDEEKGKGETVFIPWKDFRATYRGREMGREEVKPLDLKAIRRMGLMMRSFFGTQEGDFSLSLRSIEAWTVETKEKSRGEKGNNRDTNSSSGFHSDSDSEDAEYSKAVEERQSRPDQRPKENWLQRFLGCWKI